MTSVDTAHQIEASLVLDPEILNSMLVELRTQDSARGSWPSPRECDPPEAPWPAHESAVLRYLLHRAGASIDAGMDPRIAIMRLAVSAWFEGGAENYDRGQRDARPHAV